MALLDLFRIRPLFLKIRITQQTKISMTIHENTIITIFMMNTSERSCGGLAGFVIVAVGDISIPLVVVELA